MLARLRCLWHALTGAHDRPIPYLPTPTVAELVAQLPAHPAGLRTAAAQLLADTHEPLSR